MIRTDQVPDFIRELTQCQLRYSMGYKDAGYGGALDFHR